MKNIDALRLVIRGVMQEMAARPPAKKKVLPPLPPIQSTPAFDREMGDISTMHDVGLDIESMLGSDIFGSQGYEDADTLVRQSRYKDPDDIYRKPSAQWIAQHLAASADPEKRAMGQRLLQRMRANIGDRRFNSLGSEDHDD